jgi:hypothetical protein
VQALQAVLLNQDLVAALGNAALRDARDLVVQQVLNQWNQNRLRTQEEEDQVQSDGYIALTKDDTSTPVQLKIQLANEGFRFVKVVREGRFQGQRVCGAPWHLIQPVEPLGSLTLHPPTLCSSTGIGQY